MAGRTCHHCKQWIEPGEAHDCWTTTEAALTADLDEDLREAWDRLRETAAAFGEQRIYASHKSIMFSRRSCYFFVRPKRSFLELNVFLQRSVQAPQIRKVIRASAAKSVNVVHVRHRDEVEAPITDWLREAYGVAGSRGTAGTTGTRRATAAPATRASAASRAAKARRKVRR